MEITISYTELTGALKRKGLLPDDFFVVGVSRIGASPKMKVYLQRDNKTERGGDDGSD